ncbi:murein hydrolase activator EnvC family protein [Sedimenticola thiotaurini]|uniref:murein hydrolase activator EnvC family protein n=1 Tax=Sedimenticola thiotaurini TaxID=1543721 RepID=UPI00069B9575|nr:peptidoglycan DD-metalloendopeptidase family protein [Sedimenticola thiotaurini]
MAPEFCRRLAVILIPITLLSGSALAASEDGVISSREGELKQLQKEISTLQQQLSGRERERQALQEQLRRAEKAIGKTTRDLRDLAASLKRQQRLLDQLQARRTDQLKALEENRQALKQQMRSAYAMGRQERLKILLNQQDPAVVSRLLIYYDYLNRSRAEQISRLDQALKALQETESNLLLERERMRQTQAQVLAQQRSLDQEQQKRQQVLALLNQDIESKGEVLKGYQRDAQQLQNLLKKLQAEIVNLPIETEKHKPFKQLKGRLKWPIKGRLATRFGTSRAGGLKWDGVVIAAREGVEVRAVHHGRVAFADWLRGFGLLMIIDHGDGYMSLYGNNQSLFKEAGDWVEPGEPVALVGNSGGQANPGVYFGIRYKGRPVNPKRWCEATQGNRVGALGRDALTGLVQLATLHLSDPAASIAMSRGNRSREARYEEKI